MSTQTANTFDPTSPYAVVAEHVSKVHGTGSATVTALDDLSLSLTAGVMTAVTGPSGSGKSTLLHCLAGLDRPTSGRITVGGVDITACNERQLTRLRRDRIGFVFQAYNLIPTLTARENVLLPLDIAGVKVDKPWMEELIEVLGIGPRLSHRPAELSGGEQQRVAVARALVSKPAVVFADEPTGNLDSKNGGELLSLITDTVHKYGQSVVVVTHDPVVASVADRVVFLVDGKVAGDLTEPTLDVVHERMRMAGH